VSGYYDRSGRYHRPGSHSWREGWWTYAAPRASNGIGIGLELPSGRAVGWNVAFVAAEVLGAVVVHVAFGVAWWQLVASFAGVLVLGGALLAYAVLVATPRALRRHEALLRAHLTGPRLLAGEAGSAATTTTSTAGDGTGRAA
jgi:hypothetical protein